MKYKRKLLFRIGILFLLIIMIPAAVILGYYHPQIRRITSESAAAEIQYEIDGTLSSLETEFDKLYRISSELKGLRDLWRNQTLPYSEVSVLTKTLAARCAQSDLVLDILAYRKESDVIYTAGGTITKPYFTEEIYLFAGKEGKEVTDRIEQVKTPALLYFDQISKSRYSSSPFHACLVFPIRQSEDCLIFMLDDSVFFSMLRQGIHPGREFLLDSHDSIILASQTELRGLAAEKTTESLVADFLVYRAESKYAGLELTVYADKRELYQELEQLQIVTVCMIGAIVLAGAVGFYIYIRMNYRPLLKILGALGQDEAARPADGDAGEYAVIRRAISHMQQSNLSLAGRVDQYKADYRRQFAYHMVSGTLRDENNVSDIEEKLGIELYGRQLFCGFLLVGSRDSADPDRIRRIAKEMEQAAAELDRHTQSLFCPYAEQNAIFILLSSSCDDTLEALRYISEVGKRCPNELPIEGSRFVHTNFGGNIYSVCDEVRLIAETLEMAPGKIWQQRAVINVNAPTDRPDQEQYPMESVFQLSEAAEKMDRGRLREGTAAIAVILQGNNLSDHTARILFAQVFYVLSRADKTNGGYRQTGGSRDKMTRKEMADILLDKTERILTSRPKTRAYRHGDILSYIDANYLEPDFSITTLSDHFHYHPSNFSVYFKKEEDQSFQQYVTDLKMKKARELLDENLVNTEEISVQLGYANASSFGRTFKRATGKTPGEYKQQSGH